MPGTMALPDLLADLKASMHDAGQHLNAANDADWYRVLTVASTAMQAKRPITQVGQVVLQADQADYSLSAYTDMAAWKSHLWGSKSPYAPWDPAYPGALPRVHALQRGTAWALQFDPAPSWAHINAFGSVFRFVYYGQHTLAEDPAQTTLALADRPLLLLRAQAEALRELAIRNVQKTTQVRDGLSGTPRNNTPAALYQALLAEWQAAA